MSIKGQKDRSRRIWFCIVVTTEKVIGKGFKDQVSDILIALKILIKRRDIEYQMG